MPLAETEEGGRNGVGYPGSNAHLDIVVGPPQAKERGRGGRRVFVSTEGIGAFHRGQGPMSLILPPLSPTFPFHLPHEYCC